MKLSAKIFLAAMLAVVSAAHAQTTQPITVTIPAGNGFSGTVGISFAGGAPSSVTVTPTGGAAQVIAIPAPATQPVVNVPAGSPIPTATGNWTLQPGATYTLPSTLNINAAGWHLHLNGASIAPDAKGDEEFYLSGSAETMDGGSFTAPTGIVPNVVEFASTFNGGGVTNCKAGYVAMLFHVDAGAQNVLLQYDSCPHFNQYFCYNAQGINVTIDHCNVGDPVGLTGSDVQHGCRGGGTNFIITNSVLFQPIIAGVARNAIDLQLPGSATITGNIIGSLNATASGGSWLGQLSNTYAPTGPITFTGNTVLN